MNTENTNKPIQRGGLNKPQVPANQQSTPVAATEAPPPDMSFLQHLEELRGHLLRGVAAIVLFAVIAFAFPNLVFNKIVLGPARLDFITFQWLCQLADVVGSDALCVKKLPFILQSRKMTGQFSMHMLSSFVFGIIFAFPFFFWEIWRFVRPGLYTRERKAARGATFYVSLLFMLGVSFGYFVVAPMAVSFLANYQIDATIQNEFDITSYVSTLVMIVLSGGLMFQLPIVVYFLSRSELINPIVMRKYRRHAILVILFISAVITPPDPITQVFVAVPVFLLYELSIMLSARVHRQLAAEHDTFMKS